jgi:gliding motility-associated-like protein
VTVTDQGCTATDNVIITEPAAALSGNITAKSDATTNGGTDGSVTVTGTGGTTPYQYKIGSGSFQISGTFDGLAAGLYTVTVQDANLCTIDVPVTISEPLAILTGSISSKTDVKCFGAATGDVTIAASGGLPPYEYSLNGGAFQPTGVFGSLLAGPYTVTIHDALLNAAEVNFTINQPASAVGGTKTAQTDVYCFGGANGSVTVDGSGGTSPYMFKLNSGSYQLSGTFGNLTAGSYTVTVQDANLCTFDVPVTVTQPVAVLAVDIISTVNVSCSGSTNGSVTFAGSGGTPPYQFSLNGGGNQASGSFNNLVAGTYTLSVIDTNLCTASTTVTLSEPAAIFVSSSTRDASCPDTPDGSITLTISGGIQPYNVIWSDGVLTQDRQDIPDGTYSVVVTDQNSCASSLDVVINVIGSAACLEIPTIITPNNDGFNDTWKIKNIDLFPDAEVFVFTRWGKLVFQSKNLSANQWNGTYNGKLLPTDSYHYVLHLNDGSKPRSGVISIIIQ